MSSVMATRPKAKSNTKSNNSASKTAKFNPCYAHGVVMLPPHKFSFQGNCFHNIELKNKLLSELGEEECIARLKACWERVKDSTANHLRIPVTVMELGSLSDEELSNVSPDIFCVCDSVGIAIKHPRDPQRRKHLVVSSRMGAPSRRKEPGNLRPQIMQMLPDNQRMTSFKKPVKLEFGDTLPIFIGEDSEYCILPIGKRNKKVSPAQLDVRTNKEGRDALTQAYSKFYGSKFLGSLPVEHLKLHLGTSAMMLQVAAGEDIWVSHNEGLLYPKKFCEELTTIARKVAPRIKFRPLAVSKDESWAAPVLANGENVICDSRFPKAIEKIESLGFNVDPIDGEMLQALDTNWQCIMQPLIPKV